MRSLLDNPEFKAIAGENISKHEIAILIGQTIREKFYKPFISLPEVPKDLIQKALIASCTSEEEIKEVLSNAGFKVAAVSVMKRPEEDDIVGKEALLICQAIGGNLTKEKLPCMVMLYQEWPDEKAG